MRDSSTTIRRLHNDIGISHRLNLTGNAELREPASGRESVSRVNTGVFAVRSSLPCSGTVISPASGPSWSPFPDVRWKSSPPPWILIPGKLGTKKARRNPPSSKGFVISE